MLVDRGENMKTERLVMKGDTALHLLRKVSLDTLREIVHDLRGATFGDEHILAARLAQQVLDYRERIALEAEDTLVTDIDP